MSLEKKAEADAERFAKYFRELERWMPEPPSDWREKALPSKYDSIYEERVKKERSGVASKEANKPGAIVESPSTLRKRNEEAAKGSADPE